MPVCQVAASPGPASYELFRLAMRERKNWTLSDWRGILNELDNCNAAVRDWRVLQE
jgi:hypothetical protein